MGRIIATCGHEVAPEEAMPCWYMNGGRNGEELSWGVLCPSCKWIMGRWIERGKRKAVELGLCSDAI